MLFRYFGFTDIPYYDCLGGECIVYCVLNSDVNVMFMMHELILHEFDTLSKIRA